MEAFPGIIYVAPEMLTIYFRRFSITQRSIKLELVCELYQFYEADARDDLLARDMSTLIRRVCSGYSNGFPQSVETGLILSKTRAGVEVPGI